MNLLFDLLRDHPKEELAAHVPETVSYLARLERLPEEAEKEEAKAPPEKPDIIIINFYLNPEQHAVVLRALDDIMERFGLTDSSQALFRLATLYLEESGAGAV